MPRIFTGQGDFLAPSPFRCLLKSPLNHPLHCKNRPICLPCLGSPGAIWPVPVLAERKAKPLRHTPGVPDEAAVAEAPPRAVCVCVCV